MDKELTPYEESLSLKELGFDESCFGYYVDGELRGVNLGLEELGGVKPYYKRFEFHTICNSDINNTEKPVVTAPTFSQAFKWFRDKYGLFIRSDFDVNYLDKLDEFQTTYFFSILKMEESLVGFKPLGRLNNEKSYEEAELACLRKLIEIVKKKEND